ncbi:MAG: alpha/beta fold hydrolase [Burkholderiaceae bacterium]|nr:alpha/beta fold hydrolase [Burkholderiaceae bacterium]
MLHNIPCLLPSGQRARLARGERLVTSVHTASGGLGELVWHRWQPEASAPRAEAPPLVLFHGGSGSWTHWIKNIAPQLDAGRTVLAVDLPGFGDSALLENGSDADAIAPVLAAGLRALLQGQSCDLVGFSFGGLTAALMLADAPELVRRLVLVGAPAMGVVAKRQFELKAWRYLESEAEQEAMHRYNLGALMLHDHRLIDGLALQVHIANVRRDRAPRRRLARTDILARTLPRLPCPVHAIYGEHDVLYRGHLDPLARAFTAAPDFRGLTRIPDAGHWVQFEAPDAFDAALLLALE